jgi:HEAT repeat protein
MSKDSKVIVTSTIHVDSQTSGQIIGTSIGTAYFGARDIKPPDAQDIEAYLKMILSQAESDRGETGKTDQQMAELPFPVRSYGIVDQQTKGLSETIQQVFEETKQLNQSQRLVLLAEPGGGRSQALKKVMQETASRSLQQYEQSSTKGDRKDKDKPPEWPDGAVIPLSVSLADLRAGVPLLSLVQAAYNSLAPVEISLDETDKLVSKYPCLFLFDDLELLTFPGGLETLRQFMQNYAKDRYVVSCLVSAYYGQLGSRHAFVLDELTDDDIRKVLGEQRFNVLSPQVRKLARNRAMLKSILSMGQGSAIPQSKGRLVQEVTRAALGFPEPVQPQYAVDLEMLEGLLEQLAYAMLLQGNRSYSERQIQELFTSYLQEWHEPGHWRAIGRVLRRLGVLRRTVDRRWEFSNAITHAYFAAAAVRQDTELIEAFTDHASDVQWHESFEILTGLQPNPAELIFRLIDLNTILAAHCIAATGRSFDPTLGNTLVDALIDKMHTGLRRERDEVVQLLSQSGSPKVKDVFLKTLYEEKDSRFILTIAHALWVMAQAKPARSVELLQQDLKRIRPTRRVEVVVDLWVAHTNSEPAAQDEIQKSLMALLKRSEDDRLSRVSCVAAIALGSIGTEQARQTLLEAWLRQDLDEILAACIVESLTQIRHDEVERTALDVYSDAKYRTKDGESFLAQSIYLLGRVGSRPEHVQTLYRALEDPLADVRRNAAFSIGRLELADARQRLEARLSEKKEKSEPVICNIIEALGRIGTPETIELLNDFLRHEASSIRRGARESIVEIATRYPST